METSQTDSSTVPLIQVNNLTRRYGDTLAVDNVSFTLNKGEVLGFLGPNGAGKSTTMQMICGSLAPTAGEITINGHDLLDEPIKAKSSIGYLPEQPPLYRELTVDEYLLYCARLHRIPRQQIRDAQAQAKQQCGLEQVGRRLIGNLSKGYQQRVGIAQAIIHQPPVVILDEPTVGLDPIQIREIRHLIKSLGQERSVILSTHILPEVQATCDHVQIIRNGQLIYNATIDELAHQGQNANRIRIGCRHLPDEQQLKAIDDRVEIESTEGQHLQLICPDETFTDRLLQQAVQQQWGLFELVPVQHSLEEIFVELTLADQAEKSDTESSAEAVA